MHATYRPEIQSHDACAWIYQALQAAEVGAWEWDLARDQLEFTAYGRMMHGLPLEAAVSYRDWLMTVDEADRERAHQTMQCALDTGVDFRSEYRIGSADGSVRWVEIQGGGVFDREGTPQKLTGLLFDVAERKRVEQAVKEQHQAIAHLARVSTLGELSAALAHELNQPLAAILCNAQAGLRFLRQTPVDMAELRSIFADIVADDERAGAVVSRLRGLFRKEKTVRQDLNINVLVEDIAQLLRSEFIARQVTLSLRLGAGLPDTRGDTVQIRQVLLNLVMNAIEAMVVSDGRRQLEIHTGLHDTENISVIVRDTGAGVEPQMREKIFEPFVSGKPQGLGVGLAICRSIAVDHGGRLWVDDAPEGGTAMHFVLPIVMS